MVKYLQINGDEETQNSIYANLLDKSLKYGPELAEELHGHPLVEFSERSRVTTVQEKLGQDDDRELDWVITEPQIIGFESKKSDALTVDQLSDEMTELQKLSDDPVLVAITDDLRAPSEVLEKTRSKIENDGTLIWKSWHQIAHCVYDLASSPNELPPEHHPILDILQDMFESESYEPRFKGIESVNITQDDLIKREKDLLSLISDITVGLPDDPDWLEPNPTSYSSDTLSNLKKGYYHIWQHWISFRFLIEDSEDPTNWEMERSSITVLVHLTTDEFLTVLDIDGDVDSGSRTTNHKAVTENAEQILKICSKFDFQIWTSPNSWDSDGRSVEKHELGDLRELLSGSSGFGYLPHKRLMIGRQFNSSDYPPQELVKEIVKTLELLKLEFIENSEIFDKVFTQSE